MVMIIIDNSLMEKISSQKLTLSDIKNKENLEKSTEFLDLLLYKLDAKLDKFDITIIQVERKKPFNLLSFFTNNNLYIKKNAINVEFEITQDDIDKNVFCGYECMCSYIENRYKDYYDAKCVLLNKYSHTKQLSLTLIPHK